MTIGFEETLEQVRSCTLCASHLPLGPNPVLQLDPRARILIAGQAPGRKAHKSGIAFDDASGDRLRSWLGLDRKEFYRPGSIAILPMSFCYPGKAASGDLPPRPECAERWRRQLLASLPGIRLTLLVGRHAQRWHLGANEKRDLTTIVKSWRDYWPDILPLPHPSPRNNGWLKRNPWFEEDVLPVLRARVKELI